MAQTARVAGGVSITTTASPDGGQARVEQEVDFSLSFTSGTGAGQSDLGFVDTARQLASGATEDFDLAGALTDALGNTITAVEITGWGIRSRSTNTTNLTIGGASAEWLGPFAATGDKLILRPGEFVVFGSDTGWAVTATTADDLLIANASGAAADYDIFFLGRSA